MSVTLGDDTPKVLTIAGHACSHRTVLPHMGFHMVCWLCRVRFAECMTESREHLSRVGRLPPIAVNGRQAVQHLEQFRNLGFESRDSNTKVGFLSCWFSGEYEGSDPLPRFDKAEISQHVQRSVDRVEGDVVLRHQLSLGGQQAADLEDVGSDLLSKVGRNRLVLRPRRLSHEINSRG